MAFYKSENKSLQGLKTLPKFRCHRGTVPALKSRSTQKKKRHFVLHIGTGREMSVKFQGDREAVGTWKKGPLPLSGRRKGVRGKALH